MQEHQMPFWILRDGKTEIDRMQDIECSVDASIEKLTEVLDDLSGQTVDIEISNKNNLSKATAGRAYKNYDYKIKLTNPVNNSNSGIDSLSLSLIREIGTLKTQLVEISYKNQVDLMQKRIDEIKAEKENPMLNAAIGQLISMFGVGNPQFSGIAAGSAPVLNGVDDKQDRINKTRIALNALSAVDKDLPDTLTLLAEFATKHPEKYYSFIPLIKSQI